MMAKGVTLLLLFAQIALPALSQQMRLEMPRLTSSDCILHYKGYTDICFLTASGSPAQVDLERIGFTVSFSEKDRIPLWVAYELTKEETYGPYQRSGKSFRVDESVKVGQATRYDYNYKLNGWTKGHMAPAADFKWSDEAMWDTFYFTNCCPQNEQLNAGAWQRLEDKVRAMARRYGKVWVVTGSIKGENRFGRIGSGQVLVPDAFYKALLVYDGLKKRYHAIAFVMENTSKQQEMATTYLSVNALEKRLGMDFFPSLEDEVEEAVEEEVNLSAWSIKKR